MCRLVSKAYVRYLRHVQIHRLIAFSAGIVLNEARTAALDLNLAAGSLLDMLHISTALSDYLGTKVESRNRFEVNRNTLFGPFAL